MAGHTLVFYSAAWCDPGVPMNKIFHEILRDVARARPDVSLKGIEIDVDTEEENQQTGAVSPAVSEGALASIDFLPMMVLYAEDFPRADAEILRLVGQLPKRHVLARLLEALPAEEA